MVVQMMSLVDSHEGSLAGYLMTLGAGVSFSLTAVLSTFLKNMGIPSIEQGFFRISVTSLFFAIVLLARPENRRVRRDDIKFFVINGLFGVALSVSAYLSSIALGTPVAVAVTLSYLQPMFSVILARFFLNEGITATKVVAVVASILGASIVSGLWQVFGTATPIPVVGAVLATMNGFFYSVYIIVGRLSGSNKSYNYATTMFYSFFFATFWMFPVWFVMGAIINNPIVSGVTLNLTLNGWVLILMLVFLATILPYSLLAMGLRKVGASRAGVILLIEPVSVFIEGVLILGQPLTPWGLAGAALILAATMLVSLEGRISRTETKNLKKGTKIIGV
jgi:drug/metabolite transporter (DMT)-like permease